MYATPVDANALVRPAIEAGETNKVWYLRRSRLFADTADGRIDAAEPYFTVRAYRRGERVFDIEDPTRRVFLVKTGAVRIVRLTEDGRELTVAFLGPGELFGEEAIFDADAARSTVAVVADDSLLCSISADDLLALIQVDPTLAFNVARLLNDRLTSSREQVEDVAYARVGDRIEHALRRLAERNGTVEPDGCIRLDVHLTHADLASMIGSTRETVTAELGELARAGRVRIEHRTYVLPPAGDPS